MRVVRILILLLLAFAVPSLRAAADDIEFAVPDEGRITLGVFDTHGKLVRRLHTLAEQSDFATGLNGLITRWDGRDDSGTKLPPGTYHLRGYLVGEVEVEGRSFHFNDWITSGNDPRLAAITSFALLENGDVALAGKDPDGTSLVARYSPEDGFVWSRPSGSGPSLAADASNVFLLSNATLEALHVTDGEPVTASAPLAGSHLAAATGKVFTLDGHRVSAFAWPGLAPAGSVEFPEDVAAFDVGGNMTVAATPSASALFFATPKGEIRRLEIPSPAKSVSLGMNGTAWFVTAGADAGVGQISPTGELLRTLRPAAGDPRPVLIHASQSVERFGVLDAAPGLQRFRVLERGEDGTWRIEWERSITEAPAFGFSGGNVTANAVGKSPARFTIRLDPNPLTNERSTLELRCTFDASGVQIVTPDGLVVAPVSDRPDTKRVVAIRGDSPDAIRILRGDGAVVEEFSVSGLRKIIPLDAGDVEQP